MLFIPNIHNRYGNILVKLAIIPIKDTIMQLEQFRKSKNLSHKKLAEFLGIKGTSPGSTVFRWCNKERIPRPGFMKLISEKTKGKVKPSSFYE